MNLILKTFKQGISFIQNGVIQKFNLASSEEINNIPTDSGKVVRYRNKPAAVYKDKDGKLIMVSAVCTHQGCIVKWNNAQKTWDCPCHGSRFQKTGEVINGPAKVALPTIA